MLVVRTKIGAPDGFTVVRGEVRFRGEQTEESFEDAFRVKHGEGLGLIAPAAGRGADSRQPAVRLPA